MTRCLIKHGDFTLTDEMGLERVHFQLFFLLHTHFVQKLTYIQCIRMSVDTAAGDTDRCHALKLRGCAVCVDVAVSVY
jgi:hypothetical protein